MDCAQSTALPFSKYEGAGNDFIVMDMTSFQHRLSDHQVRRMCSRKSGIGADGVLVLQKSHVTGCSFRLVHYSSGDTGEGNLCGNGSRCGLAFAEQAGLVSFEDRDEGSSPPVLFEACDGVHSGWKLSSENYVITIRDVAPSDVVREDEDNYFLHNGAPHHVRFVDDVSGVEVGRVGRDLRWTTGGNVNFVQVAGQGQGQGNDVIVRTYERGVEGETLACGTGAVASAIVTFLRQQSFQEEDLGSWHRRRGDAQTTVTSRVSMRGGELEVVFTVGRGVVSDIRLSGPARHVFDGVFVL
ncbi:diaminopimelate epimerase-like [Babylonia areolata]|uniref:diaminopimelate epimerase-like n=1 Tax=Babylonia areolata TaxID=304850 RepID=UPI003FD68E34